MRYLLFLVFALIFSGSALCQVHFRAAYEDAIQHPYYMGETSKVLENDPGAAVELVKLLETKIPGLSVSFSRCDWARCLADLEKGKHDGIFNGSFMSARLKYGSYPMKDGLVDQSRRITDISYHFYRKKGSKFGWNGKRIFGLVGKIGTPIGYSIETDLKNMGVDILSALSSHANFANLMAGKVDAVAMQEVTGDYHLNMRSGLKDIEKVYPAIVNKAYYLMISNQFREARPELAEEIWNAIGELRQERLPALIEKYF